MLDKGALDLRMNYIDNYLTRKSILISMIILSQNCTIAQTITDIEKYMDGSIKQIDYYRKTPTGINRPGR